ncbi:conserved hypothetical protein of the DUF2331 family [Candidatus Kinetoplastibacterium desouzaii TCC079E]|uniref:Protein-arginine rhamnosyltransferase n=1 Tax=Candidatus Kinetoplastidibacterium desouzai TCC079E TaxID=1208919 RepID=M1LRE7_9PROT|nr:elongation factor P maturation arginine rhamnosyltransferase EarP [Candidatus Kinetoplastibacterium desouzaii]AGF46726.1 conserved hypothetical protein of the DUF2331 family [Candidatus Kinetoplastibacterium desouzaii TCC079E]
MKIDIFCKVIDNYGDIGFCWRLARDLAHNYNCEVALIVNETEKFSKLNSKIDINSKYQKVDNIEIFLWNENNFLDKTPGNLVIESFGCNLPSYYISKIIEKNSVWINIEYLSAETWVNEYHLKPSKITNNYNKFFFFPGFNYKTGGLIIEKNLKNQRDDFQKSLYLQNIFLKSIGIDSFFLNRRNESIFCYLFCYETANIYKLIQSLQKINKQIIILTNKDNKLIKIKKEYIPSTVHIIKIPFVNQPDFDKILWSMDINFIRGEDSFVRSILANKPMIWHIYKQEEDVHIKKLKAWLKIYNAPKFVENIILSWNQDEMEIFDKNITEAILPKNISLWKKHAQNWGDLQITQASLSYKLLKFCTTEDKKDKIV